MSIYKHEYEGNLKQENDKSLKKEQNEPTS